MQICSLKAGLSSSPDSAPNLVQWSHWNWLQLSLPSVKWGGHPKMEGEGWRQVLAKASGREWKMMSLGVGRLFLASILAKNTTIWPQLEGATSPTSLDTSLGLPVAWSQGDRLSNLSRTSGSWARCVCLPASSLGLGVRLAAAGSRTFPGGVRGSALMGLALGSEV